MLARYSVKRPYTVLVAVVLVLVLGVISFTQMTTDLLPAIELPYVVVITSYPGASPEKIEATVTKPLEAALGTGSGIKNVSSTSNENASIIMLEYEQGTNMDSAMIELSSNADLVTGSLDDAVGSPMFLKISPDMLPVMVASVDRDGLDVYGISDFTRDTVTPAFERLDGVASVDATGLVTRQLRVTLRQEKIDALNKKVLASVDEQLADAQTELEDGRARIASGKAEVQKGEAALTEQKGTALDGLAQGAAQVDSASASLSALLSEEMTLGANKAGFEAQRGLLAQVQALCAALQSVFLPAEGAQPALSAENYMQIAALYEALRAKNPEMPAFVAPDAILTPAPDGVSLMPSPAFCAQVGVLYSALQQGDQQLPAFPALDSPSYPAAIGETLRTAASYAAGRTAEIGTELRNIETRLSVLSASKPALEENLQKAQSAYAELEKGKLTAVNEMTRGEVTLDRTRAQLEEAEQQLEEAQAQFDDARDAAYKRADLSGVLTMEMLGRMLAAQNMSMPAGYVTEGAERYLVKVGDAFGTPEELENLLLMHIDAEGVGDIYLSDVADIEMTDDADESYAKINGNEGVVLSFQKQSTASTASVSDRINEAIGRLQESESGLHITPLMDQGDYIRLVVDSVLSNLLWGGLLAVLVLILFLRDARPTLIVACSIPFSLLCAVTLMYFSNVTLNIISLSGLALGVGMLVDNSIVVIENIYRLRAAGMPPAKAAVEGARQVAGAIFASTLTTVCVFVPIVFTQGLSRQLFTDMGLTIGYALLASLVVALTLVPAMGASVLRGAKEKADGWFEKLLGGYRRLLAWSLRHKMPVLALALALLVFSAFLTTQMGTAFIPAMDSPQMSVSLTAPRGMDREEAYALADTLMERVSAVEGVETVGAMSGGGASSMMGGGSASGTGGQSFTFYVLLAGKRSVSNTDVARAITEAAQDMKGEVSVQESTMDMSALGGSGVELVLSGQNLDSMRAAADDLRALLRGIEGLTDISEATAAQNPETRITVNKYKAAQHGLTVAQVFAELTTALTDTTTATTLTLDDGELPVIVCRDTAGALTRETLMDHAFTVTNAAGEEETVYLRDIADRGEAQSLTAIRRENGVRTMQVTAAVDSEHNIGLVSREISRQIASLELPAGCEVALEGENETINTALWDLVKMIALAIVFIYLIMVAQFQSLLSPFIVMFTIPLAFTGGLLALWITQCELSVIAMLGFLVLAGVVVNNGIVFVDSINQLRLSGQARTDAILTTGQTRMRPVLMTALTTILAMSTMALGIGSGAEMTQPMAIVSIGGLAYATLLTLFVVPVLYDIFCRKELRAADV